MFVGDHRLGCGTTLVLESPPEEPRIVYDQAIGVHGHVCGKTPVEAHEPVESAPVVLLEAGVALRLGLGLQLGSVEVGDGDVSGLPGREPEAADGEGVRERGDGDIHVLAAFQASQGPSVGGRPVALPVRE